MMNEDAGGLKQFYVKRGSKNSRQGRLLDLFSSFCGAQMIETSLGCGL